MIAAALAFAFAPLGCGDDDTGDSDDRTDEDGGSSGSGGRGGGSGRGGGDGDAGMRDAAGEEDDAASAGSDAASEDAAAGDASTNEDASPGDPSAGMVGDPIVGEMAGDAFGAAVALSADGSRVIIGSRSNAGTAAMAGHARVFERQGTEWVQLGADLDGEAADDRFGGDVAISDDGNRIAVGSYANDGGGNGSGHVRVFDYAGGSWTQVGADLDGAGASYGHGWALALSATGHRLVVGAPTHSDSTGRAFVYELVGDTWTQLGATLSDDHEFGHAVDISGDGNRIAVSQPNQNQSDGWPGQVQVFDWDGTAWVAAGAPVEGHEPAATAGQSIALSDDGTTLVIGESTAGTPNAGAVIVVRYDAGTTTWNPIGDPLVLPDGGRYGTSVAISADGTRILAGDPGGGGVQLYTLSGDAWTPATEPDFGTGFGTGEAVALSADGDTAAIAAPFSDVNGNQSGEVRVYILP
jgi:hypothetical protein